MMLEADRQVVTSDTVVSVGQKTKHFAFDVFAFVLIPRQTLEAGEYHRFCVM
jgi:hypothetical protein